MVFRSVEVLVPTVDVMAEADVTLKFGTPGFLNKMDSIQYTENEGYDVSYICNSCYNEKRRAE